MTIVRAAHGVEAVHQITRVSTTSRCTHWRSTFYPAGMGAGRVGVAREVVDRIGGDRGGRIESQLKRLLPGS